MKIKLIVILIDLHCCNIPKGYSSKFQYVNLVEIIATQHYTSTVQNMLPEQKKLQNDRMETTCTKAMSI